MEEHRSEPPPRSTRRLRMYHQQQSMNANTISDFSNNCFMGIRQVQWCVPTRLADMLGGRLALEFERRGCASDKNWTKGKLSVSSPFTKSYREASWAFVFYPYVKIYAFVMTLDWSYCRIEDGLPWHLGQLLSLACKRYTKYTMIGLASCQGILVSLRFSQIEQPCIRYPSYWVRTFCQIPA